MVCQYLRSLVDQHRRQEIKHPHNMGPPFPHQLLQTRSFQANQMHHHGQIQWVPIMPLSAGLRHQSIKDLMNSAIMERVQRALLQGLRITQPQMGAGTVQLPHMLPVSYRQRKNGENLSECKILTPSPLGPKVNRLHSTLRDQPTRALRYIPMACLGGGRILIG